MFAPWKKSYDQPSQHIKKAEIALPTKVCLVKAMFFSVVMCGINEKKKKKKERELYYKAS